MRLLSGIAKVMTARDGAQGKTPAGEVEIEVEDEIYKVPPEQQGIQHQDEQHPFPIRLRGKPAEFMAVVVHSYYFSSSGNGTNCF